MKGLSNSGAGATCPGPPEPPTDDPDDFLGWKSNFARLPPMGLLGVRAGVSRMHTHRAMVCDEYAIHSHRTHNGDTDANKHTTSVIYIRRHVI